MLTAVYGSSVFGVEACSITIEVNIGGGIGYHLVGLPDNAIKESNFRIAAALNNIGYKLPGKKITINMAPADMRKEGSAYDVPIALGILVSSGQITAPNIDRYVIMGELALDGSIRPIKGALPIAIQALKEEFQKQLKYPKHDFSEVKGQEGIKRCMEIAAAGGHNIILIGPPGAGKTMLAKRLPSILPPMTLQEALETTKIHSVMGKIKNKGLVSVRPFRSPHHTISDVALVGGGTYPQPGEISMAHNGVLFLDELPEFKRSVLEVMRQPLEDREVTISRAKFTVTYPASFMLVASMNPSPTGYFTDPYSKLGSSATDMQRYMGKISGPLLDRIDLHIEVEPVPFEKLAENKLEESSEDIRRRVSAAREFQTKRFENHPNLFYNAQMGTREIRTYCTLDSVSSYLLKKAMERLSLSARAYDRILKVARTIADLEASVKVTSEHIAEAIQYRSLDREGWMG